MKHQVPTPYSFLDKAWTKFYRSRSLHQGHITSRSHNDIAHLHPLTNVPTKYKLPIPYGFRDMARLDFKGKGQYNQVKDQIKVIP